MEKGILDINLTNGPAEGVGQGENKADGDGLDYWTIGLSIVNARLLVKTLSDESSFVAIDSSISFAFETKNPFATNDVGIGDGRNKGPSVIAK
jgi:hypothetical protein